MDEIETDQDNKQEEEQQQQEASSNTAKLKPKPGGIIDFVAHTSAIGHVILGTETKDSYEPLPFTDYSLFDEDKGIYIPFIYKYIFL